MTVANLEDLYELSPMQQGVLFHTLYAPETGVYIHQRIFTLRGHLDEVAFLKAWEYIVERHTALRTAFYWEGVEKPLQAVFRQVTLPWQCYDWRTYTASQQEIELDTLLATDRATSFSLAQPPLMRLTLLRTAEDAWLFLWSHHYLLIDGWSVTVIFREFQAWYRLFCQQAHPTAASPRAFGTYIAWLQQQDTAKAEAYWSRLLKGFHTPLSIQEQHTPEIVAPTGEDYEKQELALSPFLTTTLQTFARQHRLTLNTLVQGAWAILLQRYSGVEDVLFGITVAGRPANLLGVDDMVGLFVNTLPLRVRVSLYTELLPWLRQLQERQIESLHYAYSSLVQMQGWSEVPRGNALFESILVFENYPVAITQAALDTPSGQLEINCPVTFERTSSPLTVVVTPGEQLNIRLSYDRTRFADSMIERLLLHFQNILGSFVTNPSQRLVALSLLTEQERQQLATWHTATAEHISVQIVHHLFEEQAARTPHALALICGPERLTYQALNARANQLAHTLRALGVGPEKLIALYVARSLDMLVAILGILKAGAAYVPLDIALPTERLTFLLEDSRPAVLLTQQDLLDKIPQYSVQTLCLDSAWSEQACTENLALAFSPTQTAYVIYTSGSTGRPKGVAVEHRQLYHYLSGILPKLRLAEGTHVALLSTIAADLGHTTLFSTLCSGGCLHILSQAQISDPLLFAEYLRQYPIDCMKIVPSHLAALISSMPPEQLLPRKLLIFGGEGARSDWARQLQAVAPCRILNHYGPTEATVGVLTTEVQASTFVGTTVLPLGRPLPNTTVYIANAALQQVPVGMAGELYIGGSNVARGYFNQPERTAEYFIPDPFSSLPGARLYKTGDRVRYLPDGNMEFLGRIDNQIKIRGYRVELGEIEAVLHQCPGLAAAAVIVHEGATGDKRLTAVLVPSAGLATCEVSAVRQFLTTRLPDYMVPAAFVVLDALPLTPNGKIDRQALSKLEAEQLGVAVTRAVPHTLIEEILLGLWQRVLGLEQIDLYANFFEIGGHSLLATQLISQIRQVFQFELSFAHFFQFSWIAGLAEYLAQAMQGESSGPRPQIQPLSRHIPLFPLSFAQQRLWILDQLEPGNPAYNITILVRLEGQLSVQALEHSLNALVQRHEVLRTTFTMHAGEPAQKISEHLPIQLTQHDLSHYQGQQRMAQVQALTQREARQPFALDKGPLLRISLFSLEPEVHLLLFVIHHIISDGWSRGILVRELATLYTAQVTGQPAALPSLPVQYADFAVWQKQWLQSAVLDTPLAYWKQRLSHPPAVLELPSDKPRPAMQTAHGATLLLSLAPDLSRALRALSQREGVTLFMTMLAAFKTLLYRVTGQEDILIGSSIANRTSAETEGLMGFFVNTLVLRTDLSGNPTFRTLLSRVRETTLGAYTHQELPFEKIVEILQPERHTNYTPFFRIVFGFQSFPMQPVPLPDLTLTPMPVETGTAKFDLELQLTETTENVVGFLQYNTDLFHETTLKTFWQRFETLLQSVIAQPTSHINALEIINETERKQHTMMNQERQEANAQKFKAFISKKPKALQLTQENLTRTSFLAPDQQLPLVVQPDTTDVDLSSWARENLTWIETQLTQYGALLFRGFKIETVERFEEFSAAVAPDLLDYRERSSPRHEVGKKVYTSTEYPADQYIMLHNENAYAHKWPRKILFFSLQAATQGGETPIADSRKVFELLDPTLRERFLQKKIMYVRNYSTELDLPWQTVFQTEDKAEVERYCREAGIMWEWRSNDRLRTKQVRYVATKHPSTGEMVWFNQAHMFHISSLEPAVRASLLALFKEEDLPRNVYYGDGSPIEDAIIEEIRTVYRQATISFPWYEGDILLVDNMLVAHGRAPYVGPRQTLVAMAQPMSSEDL